MLLALQFRQTYPCFHVFRGAMVEATIRSGSYACLAHIHRGELQLLQLEEESVGKLDSFSLHFMGDQNGTLTMQLPRWATVYNAQHTRHD